MLHDSREVAVSSSCLRNGENNFKVLKKRLGEFGEAGGLIGTEATFSQSSFTNHLRLNWTKLYFSMWGNSQFPEDIKLPSLPDHDVGLHDEYWITTTIYSETGKMKFHAPNKSRFWYIIKNLEI